MKYAKHRLNRLLRLARLELLKEVRMQVSKDEVKKGLWAEFTVDDVLVTKFVEGFRLKDPA